MLCNLEVVPGDAVISEVSGVVFWFGVCCFFFFKLCRGSTCTQFVSWLYQIQNNCSMGV